MIKVLELFAGIGACSKALERLEIEHEIVDAVEIDKYAIASFNAIHGTNFEPQDITKWNKDIDVDLIMHGSPCQDFSLAGKQAGGDEGSGTRSSLMYETIRIVEKLKPKYVIWENVKNVISKKHKHNFDNYINRMNELGYNSYYQVLNAKDYGIPQNRERVFTISIRKDIDKGYEFPPKEELKLRLKDMLEDEVDEKYYLSDTQINKIQTSNFMQEKKRIQEKEYSDTILARDWKDPKCVRVGGIFDTEKSRHQAGSVYDKEGISPTLDVMQGGWRQPSIIEEPKIKIIGNYMPSGHDASRIVDTNGLAPTVKENHGTITAITEEKLLIKNATKKGYDEARDGDGVYTQPSTTKRGMVQKGMIQTLDCQGGNSKGVVDSELRIRKLTPKECWRLMGFDDEDLKKAEKVNSNTQLYKQAGNSIVVNVLERILENLLNTEV